jgi:hypothetical protein
MRKVLSLLATVFAVLALTNGAAFASQSASSTTRIGVSTGSAFDLVPVLGGSTFIVAGTVHSSLFGNGTFLGEGSQTGATSFTVATVTVFKHGTLTQTGAGTNTGQNTATVLDTIVGGTGEFAGATGSSTLVSISSPTSNPQLTVVQFAAVGTITLAH